MGTWNPNMPRFAKVQIEASRAYNHRLKEVELREIALYEKGRKVDELAIKYQNWYNYALGEFRRIQEENDKLKADNAILALRLNAELLRNPAGPAQTVVESERSISFED